MLGTVVRDTWKETMEVVFLRNNGNKNESFLSQRKGNGMFADKEDFYGQIRAGQALYNELIRGKKLTTDMGLVVGCILIAQWLAHCAECGIEQEYAWELIHGMVTTFPLHILVDKENNLN
jgi:hypothetical protein